MPPPAEPPAAPDAERILAALAAHGVDYVLVGGLAVQTHGHLRTTFDVDIHPRPEPRNLARLAGALNALQARILNAGSERAPITAELLPRAALWQFETAHGALDVIHDAPGLPPYDELRRNALDVRLGDLDVSVAGREDLIAMKRARGRAADLDDLRALTEPDEQPRTE